VRYAFRSEPYDPYVPRGGNPSTGPSRPGGPSKTAAIQAQIDDTVDIMKSNINKVAERGERLDDLQDKTGMFNLFLVMLSVGQALPLASPARLREIEC
jgi:hypothetical protein